MSMNFLDETDDWPEYRVIRDEINGLENKYLEFQNKLNLAESACQMAPEDDDLRLEVNRLKERLKETEKKLEETISMYR